MKLSRFIPLTQDKYGELNDCAIVSVTACILYRLQNNKEYAKCIYKVAEDISRELGYNGNSGGIRFDNIKHIYERTLWHFGISENATRKRFKGIGYSLALIKAQLDRGNPVILAANRVYGTSYNHHAVTIVGYDDDNLTIYDNWDIKPHTIRYSDIDIGAVITFTK